MRYWAVGVYKILGEYCPEVVTRSVMILAVAELLLGVVAVLLVITTVGLTLVGWTWRVLLVNTMAWIGLHAETVEYS